VKELEIEQLQHIISHAYAHAPAVKVILDAAGVAPGDIQTFADLDRIPVTSKDRLAELQAANPPFGDFLTVPLEQLSHIFLSPGPIYEPHGSETALTDSIHEILTIGGFAAGDMVLNAFGYHFIPTGLAVDEVLRQMGATVIPAGVGSADLQVKMLKDLHATGYVGTPSWLMALIHKAEESGLDLQRELALDKAIFSAEPLPPTLRATFVEQYGLMVTNAYGTAELGFLAYNTEGGMAMSLLETAVIQVVDPTSGRSVAPGEVGEVVVTTFNETYPLIRLGTGDLAMNVDPHPGESRQRQRAIILVGRVGEAVKVRGMFLHPNQLRFAAGQVPGVARLQAIVSRVEERDALILRLVPTQPDVDREALGAALAAAVQASCRLKADRIEFIREDELASDAPPIVDQRTWE
jgi:phenylacetate-CoA ligase